MNSILLVDDDMDMMRITANWLKRSGYDVSMASSGKEALKLLSEKKMDLLILDYAMPGMNGMELFEAIRGEEEYSSVPVIMRTGMDDIEASSDEETSYHFEICKKEDGKKALLDAVGRAFG